MMARDVASGSVPGWRGTVVRRLWPRLACLRLWRAGSWRLRRGSRAGADDEFGGQTPGVWTLAGKELLHEFHGGRAELKLGLASGGQGHAEMFAEQDIAKTGDGHFLRDLDALIQERLGTADRDHVVNRLHGGGLTRLAEHLGSGFGPLLNRAASLEDEFIVHIQPGFAQRAAIPLEAFLGPDDRAARWECGG